MFMFLFYIDNFAVTVMQFDFNVKERFYIHLSNLIRQLVGLLNLIFKKFLKKKRGFRGEEKTFLKKLFLLP